MTGTNLQPDDGSSGSAFPVTNDANVNGQEGLYDRANRLWLEACGHAGVST